MSTRIEPTVGRIVWYWPGQHEDILRVLNQPLPAIVTAVLSDTRVNLAVFDAFGGSNSRASVQLVQEGNERPAGGFCEWMPYQRGQAAKTEALEAKLGAVEVVQDPKQPSVFHANPVQDSEIPNNGPRVTPEDIEAEVASEHYFTAKHGVLGEVASDGVPATAYERANSAPAALGLLTFCVLVLRNGFTVTGQSACASPENFDAEIGRRIARQDAVRQVWPLLGYALRDKLAQVTP